LFLNKTLWGTILLIKKNIKEKFTQKTLKSAKIISRHVSTTLSNCNRFTQAKELAFVDELTGLYNTRYLDYFMEKEIITRLRAKAPHINCRKIRFGQFS